MFLIAVNQLSSGREDSIWVVFFKIFHDVFALAQLLLVNIIFIQRSDESVYAG